MITESQIGMVVRKLRSLAEEGTGEWAEGVRVAANTLETISQTGAVLGLQDFCVVTWLELSEGGQVVLQNIARREWPVWAEGLANMIMAPAQAVAAAPIDVTDPWRGLYLPEHLRADEDGGMSHPDLPSWPDDREEGLDKLVHAQGFDFKVVDGEFSDEAVEDGGDLYWQEMRAWAPEVPAGEWRLAWKGDTEDGPCAWFVRPMALRPDPEAPATSQTDAASGGDAHDIEDPCDVITRAAQKLLAAGQPRIADRLVRSRAEVERLQAAALAARQPVGVEPVAKVRQDGGNGPVVWYYPHTFYGTNIPDGADLFLGPPAPAAVPVDGLLQELMETARGLESTAANDRECGIEIEQALENGGDYTPDDPVGVAHGLIHGADIAERNALLMLRAHAALAALATHPQPAASCVNINAMRYLYLRAQPVEGGPWGTPRIAIPSSERAGEFANGDDADSAIDAAIAAQQAKLEDGHG